MIVCSVKEAVKLGADAVSIHVNVGADDEADMLKDMGEIAKDCNKWGMPLLAMMYPRGKKIKDEKIYSFYKLYGEKSNVPIARPESR